jgi:hypothetical protein
MFALCAAWARAYRETTFAAALATLSDASFAAVALTLRRHGRQPPVEPPRPRAQSFTGSLTKTARSAAAAVVSRLVRYDCLGTVHAYRRGNAIGTLAVQMQRSASDSLSHGAAPSGPVHSVPVPSCKDLWKGEDDGGATLRELTATVMRMSAELRSALNDAASAAGTEHHGSAHQPTDHLLHLKRVRCTVSIPASAPVAHTAYVHNVIKGACRGMGYSCALRHKRPCLLHWSSASCASIKHTPRWQRCVSSKALPGGSGPTQAERQRERAAILEAELAQVRTVTSAGAGVTAGPIVAGATCGVVKLPETETDCVALSVAACGGRAGSGARRARSAGPGCRHRHEHRAWIQSAAHACTVPVSADPCARP